jgi:hypothetical protein
MSKKYKLEVTVHKIEELPYAMVGSNARFSDSAKIRGNIADAATIDGTKLWKSSRTL